MLSMFRGGARTTRCLVARSSPFTVANVWWRASFPPGVRRFRKNHNFIVLLRMVRGNVAAVWNPLTTDGDSGIGCVVAV
jgi:hypothetical protein